MLAVCISEKKLYVIVLVLQGASGVRRCGQGGFTQVCGEKMDIQQQTCPEPGLQGFEAFYSISCKSAPSVLCHAEGVLTLLLCVS